jgi:hypothetical protein
MGIPAEEKSSTGTGTAPSALSKAAVDTLDGYLSPRRIFEGGPSRRDLHDEARGQVGAGDASLLALAHAGGGAGEPADQHVHLALFGRLEQLGRGARHKRGLGPQLFGEVV